MTGDTASKAIANKTDPTGPGAPLLHDMQNLQEISTAVAAALYHAAVQDRVATKKHQDLVRAILDTMWLPEYQTGEEISMTPPAIVAATSNKQQLEPVR
jgi:malic enzyme